MLKIYFLIVIATATTLCVHAQSRMDSLRAADDGRYIDIPHYTQNITTAVHTPLPQYGRAGLSGNYEQGHYKKPMEALEQYTGTLHTEGMRIIKGWRYTGQAAYKKISQRQLPYANVQDAYGHNPFIWADSITGNWQRDQLTAGIGLITPEIKNHVTAGISLAYQAGSGARLADPKPFYRAKEIKITPAVTYNINNKKSIGVAVQGAFANEENELGYMTSNYNDVLVYSLRGYGTYSKYPFISGERKLTSHSYYGNIHYISRNGGHKWVVALNNRYRTDKVVEGVAVRNVVGYYHETVSGIQAGVEQGTLLQGYSAMLNYKYTDGRGDDEFFKATNTFLFLQDAQARFSAWKYNEHKRLLLQLTLQPAYNRECRKDAAQEMQWQLNTLCIPASLSLRKYFSADNCLQVIPSASYRFVFSKNYTVANNARPVEAAGRFFYPLYQYLSADVYTLGLAAGYEWGRHASQHRIAAKGQLLQSKLTGMKGRAGLKLSYLFTF